MTSDRDALANEVLKLWDTAAAVGAINTGSPLVKELYAALATLAQRGEGATGGERLFMDLGSRLIRHIMDAEAQCNPPTDVELRLVSIIRERDALKARGAP